MGWSPLSRYPGVLRIAVGLLLLSNPLVVAEFDLGDPDSYRYEAAEVTFDEEGIDVPLVVRQVDPDLVCLDSLPTRTCMLESALHDRGGITYDGLPDRVLDTEYDYVYGGDGFYRPVAEERNGSVWYGLRNVSRETAMDDVATDVSLVSESVRRAVRTGEVRTSDELPGANELVAANDSYYVVSAAESHEVTGERAPLVVVLQWLLGVAGFGLVLRGQRVRVES